MSIRITELDAINSLQDGDYVAVDNESTGTHKFKALDISANVAGNIANTYSSSASYAVGQYCLYNNNLYRCTTTISTPEAWNGAHWVQVTVGEGLYDKVDKVSGKALSANDFTNTYKTKLDGIEAGAEVNIQANWTESDSSKDDYIKNKPVNATQSTSGFMSATDKVKLDSIASGAEVNVQANWTENDSSKDDYIKNKPTIDEALNLNSNNAVRNSVITTGINQVQSNLDTEITNRQNAVSAEQLARENAVSAEQTARENADNALDGRLDTVEEILPNKANIDGYYEEMTVGDAEQLVSSMYVEDAVPYVFRTTGGSADVGNREYVDKIVGGTIAWNQLYKPSDIISNTVNDVTFTINQDGTIVANGLASALTRKAILAFSFGARNQVGHKILFCGCPSGGSTESYKLAIAYIAEGAKDVGNGTIWSVPDTTYTGALSIMIAEGYNCENLVFKPQCFDLTQMFGSAVADQIYAMEQAEAGTGVAFFKSLFPKPYYEYNVGELMSVNVSEHNTVGFNAWDEEWEAYGSTQIKSKNLIPLIAGATYYLKVPAGIGGTIYFKEDADIPSSSNWSGANETFTVPSNCHYGILYTGSGYGTTYNNDICINLSWSGYRNGEYEAYEKHSYPLDSSLTLRGISKLDASNNWYYDGDEYAYDGTVTRRYGIVDLGSLTWAYDTSGTYGIFYTDGIVSTAKQPSGVYEEYICVAPIFITAWKSNLSRTVAKEYFANKEIGITNSGANKNIVVRDDAYSSVKSFTTAMSGVYLVYELETPTTESADAYQQIQICNDFGTEEFVVTEQSGVKVPVGSSVRYPANLRDKLQHLPDLAENDGTYLITQVDKQMSLTAYSAPTGLPTAPGTDGTYVLKCTVSSGAVTYTWESEA